MQKHDREGVVESSTRLRELADRIAKSEPLRRSPRLCELFFYLFEHSLSSDADGLHEQRVGEKVFGRPSDYDTSADTIVRSSVFQLRKKLESYFAEVGAEEPVIITIPKGRYLLEFNPRNRPECVTDAGVVEAEEPILLSHPGHGELSATPRRSPTPGWRAIAAVGVVVLAVLVGFRVWKASVIVRPSEGTEEHHQFWRQVFGGEQESYIVTADAGFGLLQDLSGMSLGLDEFLHGLNSDQQSALARFPPDLVNRLTERQYTSVSDSTFAFKMGGIAVSVGGQATVRPARSINIRDLKTRNLILLGSQRSNPWVSLLHDRMTFRIEYDHAPPRGFIRNMKPVAGEPLLYRATAVAGSSGAAFGLITFLPNLDDTGNIVSIAGTNMEGTEAAADFLLREKHFQLLAERLNKKGGAPVPHFEAVIRATSVGGAGSAPEILAVRMYNEPKVPATR